MLQLYRRAQDGFDAVVTQVPAGAWDKPSECSEWTVGDVAGHVIWGQHRLRTWATGEEWGETAGAPGSPHPAVMMGDDPVATWRAARSSCFAALTEEALARTATLPGLGEVPVGALISLMITDHVAHTWDIGHALGLDVHLDEELVAVAFDWSRKNVVRRPGFFGPELTPPTDAGEQTRMLAFLGRRED
ncbi:TIGR03086 family metal-binding protein [Actinocrispum sp. NPDC049592]|uniref:TIGR03086 family metal-binding protein n=1 Tax=Actinocrispum sp. NPDC049592 TaxID=3154835 RepID=UPI0034448322